MLFRFHWLERWSLKLLGNENKRLSLPCRNRKYHREDDNDLQCYYEHVQWRNILVDCICLYIYIVRNVVRLTWTKGGGGVRGMMWRSVNYPPHPTPILHPHDGGVKWYQVFNNHLLVWHLFWPHFGLSFFLARTDDVPSKWLSIGDDVRTWRQVSFAYISFRRVCPVKLTVSWALGWRWDEYTQGRGEWEGVHVNLMEAVYYICMTRLWMDLIMNIKSSRQRTSWYRMYCRIIKS